ncbi:M15 family metallopeptidase [uncultured Fibrobacter sp.]|uniref:M15 family metallopeptidase n=1 Tax=uncultured Fibrobacter sp. TaxID=261512 RepID=UPI0025FD16F4|nr:M15 family metallopeptidase [uncultured Fibrobacter sp.]
MTSVFAQGTDAQFVPPKPAKPLRFCTAAKQWIDYASHDSNLVEITHMRGIRMDLRYGTFNNVTGHDLYCGIQRAFLHRDALPKLRRALTLIAKELPGYSIVIFDAARPMYAQAALKSTVAGTPYSNYVSSGKTGGLHNYGLALDIGLADSTGALLDMGTDFDSFETCAGEVGEAAALESGRLTQQQIDNRNLFRNIMKRAGWVTLQSEWWHFNAYTRTYTKEHYPLFPL